MSSAAEPMKKVKLSEILGGLDDVKERLKIIEASVKDTETGRTWQETTKTTMKELEGLKKTIENQSKQLTEVVAENKNLRKKVEVLQKNLDDIRNENPSTTSGESSDESDRDDALLKSEVKKAEASEVAKMLMACISGTWYPDSNDTSTWPRIVGTDDPVIRFRWDEPWDHPDNYRAIRLIMAYMRRHGANIVPAAAPALKYISDEDHQRRVRDRFWSVQKQLREEGFLDSHNKRIEMIEEEAGPENRMRLENNEVAVKALESKKKRALGATLTSRAQGKLEVRKRKRQNLLAGSKYLDTKYDAAFSAKLMHSDWVYALHFEPPKSQILDARTFDEDSR